jgi:RNA polymerase subunit RPABC4/transcription elongation factor Spt4
MEDESGRVSFRLDKKSEAINQVKKNRFGHTISSQSSEEVDDSGVQLRVGGTGVEAYVDLFDSPTMKKFMQNNNLGIEFSEAETIVDNIEEDLSEDVQEEINPRPFVRPQSLEEFDKIADEVMGIAPVTKTAKRQFAQPENNESKVCNSCKCKIKANSNFCPNCGAPQAKVLFCKNCGNKFESSEKFCSECGNKRE